MKKSSLTLTAILLIAILSLCVACGKKADTSVEKGDEPEKKIEEPERQDDPEESETSEENEEQNEQEDPEGSQDPEEPEEPQQPEEPEGAGVAGRILDDFPEEDDGAALAAALIKSGVFMAFTDEYGDEYRYAAYGDRFYRCEAGEETYLDVSGEETYDLYRREDGAFVRDAIAYGDEYADRTAARDAMREPFIKYLFEGFFLKSYMGSIFELEGTRRETTYLDFGAYVYTIRPEEAEEIRITVDKGTGILFAWEDRFDGVSAAFSLSEVRFGEDVTFPAVE